MKNLKGENKGETSALLNCHKLIIYNNKLAFIGRFRHCINSVLINSKKNIESKFEPRVTQFACIWSNGASPESESKFFLSTLHLGSSQWRRLLQKASGAANFKCVIFLGVWTKDIIMNYKKPVEMIDTQWRPCM